MTCCGTSNTGSSKSDPVWLLSEIATHTITPITNSYWGAKRDYRTYKKVVSIRDGGIVPLGSATMLPPKIVSSELGDKTSKLAVLDPFIKKVSTSGAFNCLSDYMLLELHGKNHSGGVGEVPTPV